MIPFGTFVAVFLSIICVFLLAALFQVCYNKLRIRENIVLNTFGVFLSLFMICVNIYNLYRIHELMFNSLF